MRPLLLVVTTLLLFSPAGRAAAGLGGTAVLAAPDDPYRRLAEEIAATEGLALVPHLDRVPALRPEFLLWVAAPDRLSDRELVELGRALRRPGAPSIGIISASTEEQARELWLRGSQTTARRPFAVNSEYPTAGLPEARIVSFPEGRPVTERLAKPRLLEILPAADYLTFTGHGGGGWWRLDRTTRLAARDLPALPPLVVTSAGCQTFRPWRPDSIARAFVDRGAAAYSGFAYSPLAGSLIGAYQDLPLRHAWPGVPIGHILRVHNHATLRAFARLPFLHLLGDPRITFRSEAPYRPAADRFAGAERRLRFAAVAPGIVPLRIPDGAAYRFVEAPGRAAVRDGRGFYDSRLQTAALGRDRLVLVAHSGGELELRLRRRPPPIWALGDLVTDSLDYSLLHVQRGGGSLIATVLGALILAAVYLGRRRADRPAAFLPPVLAGVALALLHGLYGLARLERVTITSKPVALEPLSLLATLLLGTAGAWIFLAAGSRWRRTGAVLLPSLPAAAAAGFYAAAVSVVNLLALRRLDTALYNYAGALLPLPSVVLGAALTWTVFGAARRLVAGRRY